MNKKTALSDFYQNINEWIEQTKSHEITKIVEVVEQAKAYISAAESIPQQKIEQFIDSFIYDLHDFYQQNQKQVKNSVYLTLMNERLWQSLATMTDKSQVEWSELMDDFEHDGIYRLGDYIGFGELCCEHCQEKMTITHLTKVTACSHCHGETFIRQGMMP